jgi:hypothetical protein
MLYETKEAKKIPRVSRVISSITRLEARRFA